MKTDSQTAAPQARASCAPLGGLDDAPENFCEICCARKVAPPEYPNDSVCQCKGLQPYAMSTYPGEYRLVKSHPNSGGHQWYKRADVDAKLEAMEKRAAAHLNH